MNPFRTVGGRLALALLVVLGGALGIIYLIVVPSYSNSLQASQRRELRRTLELVAALPRVAPGEVFPSQAWIEDEAEKLTVSIGARVAIFSPPPLLEPVADSNLSTSVDIQNDPIAAEAAVSTGIVTGTTTRLGTPFSEAALSLGAGQPILLLSAPLNSAFESVAVVRRRVLIAGGLATVFAMVLGYALAALFARRIRRLETAAERIAAGRFDVVVVDDSADELGQLSRAFEQMRQRLSSLERARNEFIANASHELRTPLFSLAGFLELLSGDDEVDADTRSAFLAAMREQVSRLTRLATVLLDLTRLDAGQLTVAHDRVDLATLVETLAAEFDPRVRASGHELVVSVPLAVSAHADEARVLQIGRILLDNALVHTPPGTSVEIGLARAGEWAQLTVSDDGPGIPSEAAQSVFERFFRLSGGRASGSGLGLAIALELAQLMGGSIELVSEAGWTRFTLTLPIESASSAPRLAAARGG